MDVNDVTDDMVAQLREAISEPTDEGSYTTEILKSKIAAADGSIEVVAYYVWRSKAAALSALVDITEGGSSRRNSQAFTNATEMVKQFAPYIPVDPVVGGARHARTRAITRP